MGKFNVFFKHITCEYVTELPFTIEDNSSSLLSPYCSFLICSTLNLGHPDGYRGAKSYTCTIEKGNILKIFGIKLEEEYAEQDLAAASEQITKVISFILEFEKYVCIAKENKEELLKALSLDSKTRQMILKGLETSYDLNENEIDAVLHLLCYMQHIEDSWQYLGRYGNHYRMFYTICSDIRYAPEEVVNAEMYEDTDDEYMAYDAKEEYENEPFVKWVDKNLKNVSLLDD